MKPTRVRRRSDFLTNVLTLVGGTTLAQLITILTAPIISRLFTPETFGILNVFTSLLSIIVVIICLRYEFAIVLPDEDNDAANVFALCVLITLVISLLTGLGLLFFGARLASLLNAPNLTQYLWLIPVGLVILGFFQALNYWNTRRKRFKRLSIARISASATTSALPIALAYLGHASATSLVFSYLAGSFIFTCVLGIQVLKDDWKVFYQNIHSSRIITNLKRYRKFPLVDSWGSFLNNLSWQLPSLMLLYFFSETVVGYYSLSNRIIVLPMTLLGNAVSQVFFQHTSELRSNPENLAKSVEMIFRRLTAIGLFPALVLGITGPALFSIVFGANWEEAGRYAQILSPWMFMLFISAPLSALFSTLERQELALVVNIAILVTRFLALLVGGLTHNIYTTLFIWSGTGVLVYGGLALWLLRLAHVPLRSAFGAIFQYLLYALLPALLLVLLNRSLTHYAVLYIILTAAISLGYYAIVLIKEPGLRETLYGLLPARPPQAG